LEVERATTTYGGRIGVKWYHVAVIHMREADADFHCYLGNGQSLSKRTTLVPKGRGPFSGPSAFVDGCLDALAVDGLNTVMDWKLEKILYFSETFNGGGYARRGLPSPYIWGGTNIQKQGKFVKDGVFNWRAWDTQPGCAPLLHMMQQMCTDIEFEREI
jgi:lysozyme family protein